MHRRQFLTSGLLATAGVLTRVNADSLVRSEMKGKIKVVGHPWVYASRFPAPYDCTPILEEAFAEIKAAGFSGIEVMKVNLLHGDAVPRLSALARKYDLPVTGCSFGEDMWNPEQHTVIMERVNDVTDKLALLGGKTFGLSVGNARRIKTPRDFDAQASILQKILMVCKSKDIIPNLHNHTYEVENNLHDLKGTLERLPDMKLGPDLNWLVRGGVDPVAFINTYGKQITYMHLRDQRVDGKWAEALGEGITDFKAIAWALKKANFQGSAAVELAMDTPATRPLLETWTMSRTFVKQTFGW